MPKNNHFWVRIAKVGLIAMTWKDAILYSYKKTVGSRKGRLSRVKELASLLDEKRVQMVYISQTASLYQCAGG
ncbi:MAG: hypothetical protein DYG83_13670 [Candidatus Brocadia sp. AMX2]|uniref:Uncharacterized protein n=1 Tax=Candidatus Brocadia sinica JPN1 TaxID=1197129 RepID=A0ABQ0K1U9_9BACT|nr:hypothetical protein [Candidatus Brocadia sp.]MBL1168766.1 hypothetical protein [Candidatus Brocadia sp. AMX1]MCE7867841.1 hypothetical protein [Candidatus Brocadia sp. AMX2]GAN35051.1 hypothetical protein BROSI_A3597 [Candidatus Brocadia sinica JPN1]GIK12060.1 MAG: hypothetical protein BroJett002_07670 [Candidatus Brocadia sinica]